MKILFMGTPEFAVPCLRTVLEDGHEVPLVITQPDKPKGRGYALTPPPVKQFALEHGIEVYQPVTVRDNEEAFNRLSECGADAAVVVAYGKILPRNILDIPKLRCINVHASLLPLYRGAAPIQWSVINGEKQTGVTTMLLDEGLDTGDMLLSRTVDIGENTTAGELHDILMAEGAAVLSDTLRAAAGGNLVRIPQNDEHASYAPMLSRDNGSIDWTRPSCEIHNLIRGLNPWPSAYTVQDGKRLKIYRSVVNCDAAEAAPGTIISTNPFTVACGGNSTIVITELQPEGGRRMRAEEYARGKRILPGSCL